MLGVSRRPTSASRDNISSPLGGGATQGQSGGGISAGPALWRSESRTEPRSSAGWNGRFVNSNTSDGGHIKVNLIPMGSLEGAHALLAGDQRINVWSPASAVYKDAFVQEWQVKNSGNPILKEEPLALSPMVFVMWEERYQAFVAKYKTVSFVTIGQALAEKTGWEGIAGKPEWGVFKFGHTHPNESNSGLMTLVLAAYSFHHKTADLELKDILNSDFQTWLRRLERGVSGMSNSTGNMMRRWSSRDRRLRRAVRLRKRRHRLPEERRGSLGPASRHLPGVQRLERYPYYIIDAPWSSKEQRNAADKFLAFLLTEPIQKESLVHGFRPANPNVPVKFAQSPFVMYSRYGIQVDLQKICEPPKAEVVNNLLASWQRTQGNEGEGKTR